MIFLGVTHTISEFFILNPSVFIMESNYPFILCDFCRILFVSVGYNETNCTSIKKLWFRFKEKSNRIPLKRELLLCTFRVLPIKPFQKVGPELVFLSLRNWAWRGSCVYKLTWTSLWNIGICRESQESSLPIRTFLVAVKARCSELIIVAGSLTSL